MSDPRLHWSLLLKEERLPKDAKAAAEKIDRPSFLVGSRTESERDFDRILFAAATRRLGDKTQVFPLDRTDNVRNRLTHSHEVSNLARSIGTHLVHSPIIERMLADANSASNPVDREAFKRAVPAILAAAGLAHDMGNPPFGHSGEETIRFWFLRNQKALFSLDEINGSFDKVGFDATYLAALVEDVGRMKPDHVSDFMNYEGNAQMVRTLSRLQVVKDDRGLNLTFATLATLMKYTVGSAAIDGGKDAPVMMRKPGYFVSESRFVEKVRASVGLSGNLRHPLTYIMEACDDIAYLVIDAEDAIKKQIVSFHDLMAWLDDKNRDADGTRDQNEVIAWLVAVGRNEAKGAREAKVPPSEVNDVAMQIFRANAISAMVSATITAFEDRYDEIMTAGLSESLLDVGFAGPLAKSLYEFDKVHAYKNRKVLEIELNGFNILNELMDMLWRGIAERKRFDEPASERTTPFARYAYSRISENYRRVFERRDLPTGRFDPDLPMRYRELQLLTDMVAGMTDRYAVDLHRELKAFDVAASR